MSRSQWAEAQWQQDAPSMLSTVPEKKELGDAVRSLSAAGCVAGTNDIIENPCVDRLAHAGTHIHTFTKIKSIIDKNSK